MSSNISPYVQMRLDSARFPRLVSIRQDQAIRELSQIVTQAFLYRGQAADPQQVNFIATTLHQELMNEISGQAKFLSMTEISQVVKRAVLGETELYGISVASLYRIIMDYVNGDGLQAQQEANRISRERRNQNLLDSPVGTRIKIEAAKMITSKN